MTTDPVQPGTRAAVGREAKLIRRVRFRATHRYGWTTPPSEDDRARFGDQVEANEHDWYVEVHVAGPIDPRTGWVTNLRALDAHLDRLMDGWDGGDLNERVPPVAEGRIQPSTEELAVWLFGELHALVAPPARVTEVRMFESVELGACFPV